MNIEKKTKIIATIGPVSNNYEKMVDLVNNGVNIFRLNFSHGDFEEHSRRIDLVNRINKEKNTNISILLDTKGPEIRIGKVENDEIFIKKDHIFRICFDNDILGNSEKISINCPAFFDAVKENELIKIDDGNFNITVIEKKEKEREIIVKAKNDYLLESKKSVSMPKQRIKIDFISEKDKKDLIFGCQHNVDYIAASFTSKADDIRSIRKILKEYNKEDIRIIAKIENSEALKNIDEIIEESDGIMVARGDLGLNTPLEEVPIHQKEIIKKCRNSGKAVIVATQMLNNMQSNPQPTRAEVSDIFMAINESADAIMLSGETASGKFPSESVEMQKNIAITSEKYLDYKKLLEQNYTKNSNAIANSISNAALLSKAKAIIVFTNNINSIQHISKARPICPIIFVSNDRNKILKSSIYWGVYGYFYDSSFPKTTDIKKISFDIGKKIGLKENDPFIIASNFNSKIEDDLDFMHISHIKDNDE